MQLADFVAAAAGRLLAEVSGGYLLHGTQGLLQRRADLAGDDERGEDAHEQRQQRGEDLQVLGELAITDHRYRLGVEQFTDQACERVYVAGHGVAARDQLAHFSTESFDRLGIGANLLVQGGELCVEAAIETRHQAWQLVHRGGDLCVHQFFGVGVGVTGVAAYVVAEQDQVLADLVDRFAAYNALLGIGQGAYLGANGLDAGERTGGKGAHFLLCRAHFLVRLEALRLVGGIPSKGLLCLVDQRQALWLDQGPA
ncbi:hypothetical protein D3C79_732920 [compost metagenome]